MKNSLILLLAILTGCLSQKEPISTISEIMEADRAMSAMALREGFNHSILHYADNHLVKLSDGAYPIMGKNAFEKYTNARKDVTTLSWEPVSGEVAHSGELGYTWGNWKFVLPDTIIYGNYFTVWKKQEDGTWKVALDGGNTTPPPSEPMR